MVAAQPTLLVVMEVPVHMVVVTVLKLGLAMVEVHLVMGVVLTVDTDRPVISKSLTDWQRYFVIVDAISCVNFLAVIFQHAAVMDITLIICQ